MKPFDTHCHIDELIKEGYKIETAKVHISGCICPGVGPINNIVCLELARKYKGFIHAAMAVHPTQIPKLTDREIEKEIEFIRKNKGGIVAIGECGLDNMWIKRVVDENKRDIEKVRQEKWFKKLVELSIDLDLPIIVHHRWAVNSAIKVLEEYKAKKVVLHSFSGTKEQALEAVKKGWLVSVNPNVRDFYKDVPLEGVVLETDSPYMRYKGEKNTPESIRYAVENLAKIKNISKEEVIKQINKNVKKLFGV